MAPNDGGAGNHTMTITLTQDIERALTERAQRQGTTPELLALNDLRSLYVPEEQVEGPSVGKTLADVLAGHLGTVDSSARTGGRPSRLSEDDGSSFAAHLAEKRRQGHL